MRGARRSRRTTAALASLAAVAVALAVTMDAAAGRRGSQPGCGATITVSTKLEHDLVNCPNNGLVIGADDITLDLDGHVIDGDGTEFASCPPDEACDLGVSSFGHRGVTVKGGRVREFTFGVLVVDTERSRIADLALTDHLWSGLLLAGAASSAVERLRVSANGLTTDQAGIDLFDSHDLRVAGNVVTGNGDIGVYTEGLDSTRFEGNLIAHHPEAGIILNGSGNRVRGNRFVDDTDGAIVSGDDNVIAGNHLVGPSTCAGECGFGISLEGGARNAITGNGVLRFHQAGIRVASFEEFGGPPTVDTTVRGNLVVGTTVDGILVEPTATGSLVERNVALRAGDDGIDVDSPTTTLTRNRAHRNGDLGIEAVAGVIDGGGNVAAANGDPAQCTGVAC
jgi:parallel beta-helix repeat protein